MAMLAKVSIVERKQLFITKDRPHLSICNSSTSRRRLPRMALLFKAKSVRHAIQSFVIVIAKDSERAIRHRYEQPQQPDLAVPRVRIRILRA